MFNTVILISHLVLCLPLWKVYKLEGTLDPAQIAKRKHSLCDFIEAVKGRENDKYHDTEPQLAHSNSISVASSVPSTDSNQPKVSDTNSNQSDISVQTKPTTELLPLYVYLTKGKEDYEEFMQFLAKVFALENLLFLVRILVFRNIVLEMVNEDKERKTDKHTPGGKIWKYVFALQFDYIDDIYAQSRPDEKQNIHDIADHIYDIFVCEDSQYEINISYEMRVELNEYFKDKNRQRHLEDYLKIFNDSIIEIYGVLNSVYRFQFQSNKRYA